MSVWAFIGCISLDSKPKYGTSRRSQLYRNRNFYLIIMNICGLVPLIAAVVLGPSVGLTLSRSVCSERIPVCSSDTNIFSLISIRGNMSVRNVCLRFRITTILGIIVM